MDGSREFALQYLSDPTAFYLVGRVTVALLGAMTTLAVFHVGRRVYNTRIGLGAAFLAAVASLPGRAEAKARSSLAACRAPSKLSAA